MLDGNKPKVCAAPTHKPHEAVLSERRTADHPIHDAMT